MDEYLTLQKAYLTIFDQVMTDDSLDTLVFPQTRIFAKAVYDATTVSEMNIAGLPGVTVPAGAYLSGAPFALIFVGRLWSEADLLGYAFDYEQATKYRIVPELVAELYPEPEE